MNKYFLWKLDKITHIPPGLLIAIEQLYVLLCLLVALEQLHVLLGLLVALAQLHVSFLAYLQPWILQQMQFCKLYNQIYRITSYDTHTDIVFTYSALVTRFH